MERPVMGLMGADGRSKGVDEARSDWDRGDGRQGGGLLRRPEPIKDRKLEGCGDFICSGLMR